MGAAVPLSPGVRFGPYEIINHIGAGGMGEVYRATDTRLDRTVAIKVLPAHLADQPDARQRLEREARAVSALNHPNICTLHDIGVQDGIHYLVLEHLEGETLADRLKRGPLSIAEALRHAMQITDALDRAHSHGVIHRDLKPGNIMITKDGVKVLDFGLAKMRPLAAAASTMTQSLTAAGTLVGTWQYMAPELLEGKEADARSDIFAFGAVFYEMVTGKAAFEGRTQASVIAAIMERQPSPMSSVQAATPPALEHVVQTCLAKDPTQRRQSLHDVLLELKWIAESGAPAPLSAQTRSRERYWMAAAAILAILCGGLSVWAWSLRGTAVETGAVHFTLPPPEGQTYWPGPAAPHMAVSPDGHMLVFASRSVEGRLSLWVRPLDSLSAQRLDKTDGASPYPFWSPDSKSIAFFADGKLKRIAVSGGSLQVICDAPQGEGGTWSTEGVIVFAPNSAGPLHRVLAAGGISTPVTAVEESRGERHAWPQFLPDGRHFLYLSRGQKSGIYVQTLGSNDRKLVLETLVRAAFVPPGRLLFIREGTLMAQDLDPGSVQLKGEPAPVAEEVNANEDIGRAAFSVSGNGVLVYRAGEYVGYKQVVSYTRDGTRSAVLLESGPYQGISLSPDGKRLMVIRRGSKAGSADLRLLDVASGIFSRLTLRPDVSPEAVWATDSRRVAVGLGPPGKQEISEIVIGSSGETKIYTDGQDKHLEAWTPDGTILYYVHKGNGVATYSLQLSGERKPTALLQSEYLTTGMRVSPDGNWVAYSSNESGRPEVYLATFPGFSEKRTVSTGGGINPNWRGDGKELFYLATDQKLMAVDFKSGATGPARALFQTRALARNFFQQYQQYGVTPDGQKFLMMEFPTRVSVEPLHVIVNWPAALAR
jgi:eukaryotic-like serine/threonine-protein kinase